MWKALAVAWTLTLAGFWCLAQAQVPVTGAGVGAHSSGGGGYSGPGDVSSGAYAWWGLRCYNTAYTGNVADIWDSSTGSTTETLLTCSAGGTINQTINTLATTCAVSCAVKTLYDQSGNTHCTTACNATQATNANRPTFTTSGCTGLSGGAHTWCMTGNGTTTVLTTPNTNLALSTGFTVYCVESLTSNGGSHDQGCMGNQNGDYSIQLNGTVTTFRSFCGTVATVAGGAPSTWYAYQQTCNGASGSIYVNGTQTTASNGTNGGISGNPINLVDDGFGSFLSGTIVEIGIWPTGQTANYSTLNSNIRGTANGWGF